VRVEGVALTPRQAVRPSPMALFALAGNEGPTGPEGPQGPQGPQGATGPQGPPGDSHWQLNGSATYYTAGNVGIGTANPAWPLEIESGATRGLSVASTASSGTRYGVWGESNSTSGRGVLGWAKATSGVNYGVRGESSSTSGRGVFGWASASSGTTIGVRGASSSTSGLGVYGIATATSGVNYGVFGVSNSTSGFDFYAAGAGIDYGAASSIRWKHNIEAIPAPLAMLAALRGVYFDWDEEHGGQHDIGMIAEEVGAVLPEIVQYEENGVDAIGMDYSKLTPLLVAAVNALRAEKDAQLAEQERALADLRAEKDAQLAQQDQQLEEQENALADLRICAPNWPLSGRRPRVTPNSKPAWRRWKPGCRRLANWPGTGHEQRVAIAEDGSSAEACVVTACAARRGRQRRLVAGLVDHRRRWGDVFRSRRVATVGHAGPGRRHRQPVCQRRRLDPDRRLLERHRSADRSHLPRWLRGMNDDGRHNAIPATARLNVRAFCLLMIIAG